ncbi:MAG TPA: tetratricopeptide repeat protein [Vicinamibacterales bacterium]
MSRFVAFATALLLLSIPSHAAAQAEMPFDALARRAAAARETGRLVEALALYQQGVEMRPDWDEGLWYVGSLLYELERWPEAIEAFNQVIARQPSHAGAVGLRGLCEFQAGRHEDALRSLLRSRALGIAGTPEVATVVRYHAGILLTRVGEFEIGYTVLSEFAKENTESPRVLDALGLNLLRRPILPRDIAPADAPVVRLAGQAAYAMGARRAAQAAQLLDELVTKHPDVPNVHYARGIFRLTESPATALEDFRREIARDPAHVPARLQIAFELIRQGSAADARPFASEVIRLAPKHFAGHLALGQALLELDDVAASIASLERAVQLAPGSPQCRFMLARAYARAGRREDAERERREFTRLQQLASEGLGAIGGVSMHP